MVMLSDKVAEELVQKAAQGHFKYIYETLESDNLVLEQSVAVKITIGCCRATSTCKNVVIIEENLCNVLIACTKFIHVPDDRLCIPYLQSLYHITAFLLEKENFKGIIKLEEVLMPAFIDSSKNEALLEIYNSLSSLIYKSIGKLKPEVPKPILMKLYLISLKIFSHCLTVVKLLNVASSYFQTTNFINADIDLQCECYLFLWSAISEGSRVNINDYSDICKAILETLQITIINLFKKREYKNAKMFLLVALRTLTKLCKGDEYLHVSSIIRGCFPLMGEFKKVEVEEFITNLQTSFKDLKYLSAQAKWLPEVQTTCTVIFFIFQEFLECCKSLDDEMWTVLQFEEVYVELSKVLDLSADILAGTKMKCRFCSKCNVKTNVLMSINVHALIMNFLKVSLNRAKVVSDDTYSYILQSVSKCCGRIVYMKTLNCEQWKSAWARLHVTIFNSVIKMYQQNHAKCISYGALLINTALKLGNTTKLNLEPEILSKTFRCISQKMFDDTKLETAAVFAALEIFYCNDLENMSFSHWIQIKFHSKDDLIKRLTVVCALTKKTDIIRKYFPSLDVEISNEMKEKILMRELAQYKQKWPSRIPMGTVIINLCDIIDPISLGQTVVQTWGNDPLENEDVSKLIPMIIEKLSKTSTVEGNICLALLHIMQYHNQMQELQTTIEENMKNIATPPKAPASPNGMPKDPKDECNLASLVNLNLNQYSNTVLHLNTSLRLIKLCISKSALDYLNEYSLYKAFENVAYEFEKHGDSLHAVQAWFVCFKVSKVTGDKLCIIKSASFILRYSNVNSKTIKNVLKDCSNIVSDISSSEVQVLEALSQYYMNKSFALLRNGIIEESISVYQQALDFFMQISEDARDAFLKINLDFLNVQHMLLPCDVAVENHGDYALSRLFSVLKRTTNHMKCHGGAREVALLLEVNEYLVKMYKSMRFSREVRCYCRSVLAFAQKQFLPLRIANIITHLTYADLISVRFDDTKVKLKCLEDILGLEESNMCIDSGTSTTLQDLIDSFSKIPSTCESTKDSSPSFRRKPIVIPPFLSHKSYCACYYCTSFEYRHLVLVYFTLEALLHCYIYSSESASACFEAALQFYRYINDTNNQFEVKITGMLDGNFLIDTRTFLLEAYGTLLFHYGNELLRAEDIMKAASTNTDLMNAVKDQKRLYAYLYNETIIQAINILIVPSTKQAPKEVRSLLSVDKNVGTVFKTPENNKKTVRFNVTYSTKPKCPPERHFRKLKFNLSPLKTPDTNKKTYTAKTVPKTPLRCAITDNNEYLQEIETCSKPVLKEVSNPDNSKNEDVIPSSPNAYTPRAIKVASALRARTKLLSKRVQKSNIKINLSDDEIENMCKVNVCKNLMQELVDSEPPNKNNQNKRTGTHIRKAKLKNDVPSSQTVTRSSRNVKK